VTVTYTVRSADGSDTAPAPDPTDGNLVFATIRGATQYAQMVNWKSNENLRIEIDEPLLDSYVAEDGLLFVIHQTHRLEREDGSALPITLTKSAKQTAVVINVCKGETDSEIGTVTLVNDYTFEDLTLRFKETKVALAVTGTCRFKNTKLDADVASTLRACGADAESYGLTADNVAKRLGESGEIKSQIIFCGNTAVSSNFTVYGLTEPAEAFPETLTLGSKTVAKKDFWGSLVLQDTARVNGAILLKDSQAFGNASLEIAKGARAEKVTAASSAVKNGAKVSVLMEGTVGTLVGVEADVEKDCEVSLLLKGGTVSGETRLGAGGTTEGTLTFTAQEKGEFGSFSGAASESYVLSGTMTVTVESGGTCIGTLLGIEAGTVNGTLSLRFRRGNVNGVLAGINGENALLTGKLSLSLEDNSLLKGGVWGYRERGIVRSGAVLEIFMDHVTLEQTVCGALANEKTAEAVALEGGAKASFGGTLSVTAQNTTLRGAPSMVGVDLDHSTAPDFFTEDAKLKISIIGVIFDQYFYGVCGTADENDPEAECATLDVEITVHGGAFSDLRLISDCNLKGDLSVKIDTTVAGAFSLQFSKSFWETWAGCVQGNLTTEMKGNDANRVMFTGEFYGGYATGTVTHAAENVKFYHFEGSRGGICASLINHLKNVEITGDFRGAGNSANVESGADQVNNTLDNVRIWGSFWGGTNGNAASRADRVVNLLKGGAVSGNFYAGSGKGGGSVQTTLDGTEFSSDFYSANQSGDPVSQSLLIFSATFRAPIHAPALVFGEGDSSASSVRFSGNCTLNIGQINGTLTITKLDEWEGFHRVYVTAPPALASRITVRSGEDVATDGTVISSGYEVRGYFAPHASMILSDRLSLKLLFPKAEADLIGNLSYRFVMQEETLGAGTLIPEQLVTVDGVDYYWVILPVSIGAEDFDTPIVYYMNDNDILSTTVEALAEEGIRRYTETTKVLFQALADYSAAVNGTLRNLSADISVDKSDIPTGLGAIASGNSSITFISKTLPMGGNLGVRLRVRDGSTLAGATLVLDGQPVDPKYYVIDTIAGTLDYYVRACEWNDKFVLKVMDRNGNLCLTLTDAVKSIANQLAEADASNLRSQATIAYIQAVQNYIAAASAAPEGASR